MEETGLVGVDAAVKHENIRGLGRCPDAELGWSFDLVGSIEKLRSTLSVESLTKLVCSAEVRCRHLVLDKTHVALGLATLGQPCEVGVDVGLAPLAPERALLTKVDLGHFARALSVIRLRRLGQRLDHEAKSNSALLLHLLVLWSLHRCGSQESRTRLSFIDSNLRNSGSRWEIHRCCAVLDGLTSPGRLCIQVLQRSRQRLLGSWLALTA